MRIGMSSRAVLWAGFGSLLGLMILVAVSANRALNRIEDSSRQIRRGFLERDDLLDRLRANLYRSSIDIRDYLLHADPACGSTAKTPRRKRPPRWMNCSAMWISTSVWWSRC
jgi:hypothetical protein